MPQLPNDFIWLILATFGGITRYLDTYLKGKEVFSIPRMIATIIVCSFCGYMCAMFVSLFYPSWVLVSAGMGGYAGVEALNALLTVWKNKITINGSKDDKK